MNPFQARALQYLDSGLGSPIPSAYPLEKSPPISGWTGRNGAIPDRHQVKLWMETHPDSNVLIRMAPDVVGIDVDDYDDKHGHDTLGDIAREHGPLPQTHVSSARSAPSGIYWFRLRAWMDTDQMRDPGEHIEVIRYGHRYAVAPPSWHQGARSYYRWNARYTPHKDDLPYLPVEWYVHLTRGCSCFDLERAERKRMMRRMSDRPTGEAGFLAAEKDFGEALVALKATTPGSRNNFLSTIAGRFLLYDVELNGVLSELRVMNTLYQAGIKAGLDEEEVRRTIQSARDWARREGENRE